MKHSKLLISSLYHVIFPLLLFLCVTVEYTYITEIVFKHENWSNCNIPSNIHIYIETFKAPARRAQISTQSLLIRLLCNIIYHDYNLPREPTISAHGEQAMLVNARCWHAINDQTNNTPCINKINWNFDNLKKMLIKHDTSNSFFYFKD